MKRISNNNLFRILNIIIHKNKIKLIASFIMVFIIAGVDIIIPQITRYIIDDGIGNKNISLLINLVFIYIFIRVLSATFDVILSYLYTSIKNKVTINLKVKLLNHISKLSGRYYSSKKTGNILSIMESDIFMIENFGAEIIFDIVVNVFKALISLVFLVNLQFDLFLVVLFLQLILTFSQNKMTKLISRKIYEIRSDSGSLSNLIQEYVSNIMDIVILNSKMNFFNKYLKRERALIKKDLNLNLIISSNIAISQVLTGLITILIYGLGGYKIINNKMTMGELIAFQQYTGMLIGPCIAIVRANTRIAQSKVSIDRVFSVIDEEIDIKVDNNGYKIDNNEIKKINFKNVSFRYNDDSNTVLNNINLEFEEGDVTGIVGGSGCGKSTITNLIYRLWDINEGDILIGDVNIKDINLKSLRNSIDIVTQNQFIFDDTIKNNIVLNNKIKDEELNKILKVTCLYEFIENLDKGLDEVVGEKGVKISGGQKQRISIARALVSNKKVLILDEATSALDNISQKEILNNLKEYIEDKIVIIIAHRLSTIKSADNIYVLDKGKVIESGNDKELLSEDGLYNRLVETADFV
ncbi:MULTISPECIES: ABC transporter ATP-binding protein [unclassified Clostridioides]|uniref:ABC transporter ATP-binding protein n=1 Tax=unclassified Clostridioides TaxID=2635829 RepID=UPI001D0CDA78|nr:ABC transporter ATP-binding protein [Clostridioides sp. ES-S-0049-03]MCC0653450.1 ABC transporter ATP-binding protein [Clostridioides sp. ES-S-0001-03]MCC0675902.1 ABC transporter ATP-binding protein [Clostridioides sp. ES-W-0018-02]MCC0711018.1 ABC transporter ATP-binding protein [Clostridioides sp. ES-W-0017-02]MCC0762487.1 ABC transporter ATP-binding protein [Clostridioides sp. ES-S-0006-03]